MIRSSELRTGAAGRGGRWRGAVTRALGVAAVVCAAAAGGPAGAFEALDGRVQAHGFYESQFRAISADYSEDWDVTQWYQVFNLELEVDILRDKVGPIDLMSGFVRAEVRYDCVYSRGCGMFRSINSFGDRAKSLPRRLNGANQLTLIGTIERDENAAGDIQNGQRRSGATTDPVPLADVSGISTLAGSAGADGILGDPMANAECAGETGLPQAECDFLAGGSQSPIPQNDDPFRYVFERFEDFRFAQINGIGGGGAGLPTRVLGPWLPENFFEPNALLADRINPFDNQEQSPVLEAAVFNTAFTGARTSPPVDTLQNDIDAAVLAAQASRGAGANPFRPIPAVGPGRFSEGDDVARGLYIPTAPLQARIGDFDNPMFNFRESERAWNRGSSQQDEKELKEAYLDIELFDARLWLRLGKQQIVWGKTELFRTTDQFNPQDVALASLPSLEESRIALWAARGVWSFYEVGPFSDVRAEVALNFDQHESADLGACGEAYTPNLVCELTFGLFAHGLLGTGIAGFERPPDPWEDIQGIEFGGRFEFRWDRFTFAFIDFWGYSDTPVIDRLTSFERNVDPETGLPRVMGSTDPCTVPLNAVAGTQEASCLRPGPTFRGDTTALNGTVLPENTDRADQAGNALDFHHANQQAFAVICSTTIGFSGLDPTSCAQTVFGSTAVVAGVIPVSNAIGGVLAGSQVINNLFAPILTSGVLLPLVQLSPDPNDGSNAGTNCRQSLFVHTGPEANRPECGVGASTGTVLAGFGAANQRLGVHLTPEQEALLGCGPFWGTSCDDDGLDLLNTEASALLQSFNGFEGTVTGWLTDGDPGGTVQGGQRDPNTGLLIQPGTRDFVGGPVCTTVTFGGEAGQKLPGCRGPGDAGYNIAQDGDPTGVTPDPITAAQLNAAIPGLYTGGAGEHPFTGQPWQNEMAALSWNFQALLVTQSGSFTDALATAPDLNSAIQIAYSTDPGACSFRQPQFCETPEAFFAVVGVERSTVSAGGNGRFGRRVFAWHSGGEAVATFEKRNVLGFSMDVAEDFTKANFSVEFTWINDVSFGDANQVDGISTADTYNLTISADRPTFINFLNANRTFFFNTQWFFQYIEGYQRGFGSNGPYNILGTFSVSTGYYQDRLLPSMTLVYDVNSVSGAVLPQVTYRYDEAFSIIVGAAIFMGRSEFNELSVNPLGPAGNRQGPHKDKVGVENGLSPVRDRDEVFVRLRYTF